MGRNFFGWEKRHGLPEAAEEVDPDMYIGMGQLQPDGSVGILEDKPLKRTSGWRHFLRIVLSESLPQGILRGK